MAVPVSSVVHVAVGVLEDARGRVLIARRPEHVHQGGLWEFPGGKVDSGETLAAALARELYEELAVSVLASEPLIRIRHDYPDKSVLLDVHRVHAFSGSPLGNEGQPVLWVEPGELHNYAFPEANRPIISALKLPDQLLITGSADSDGHFLGKVRAALDGGLELLQLRCPGMGDDEYLARAREVATLCKPYQAQLMCNTSPELWASLPSGVGLHLNRWRLADCTERPVPATCCLGASCHNVQEVAKACALGVDYLCLSPVLATDSHPHAEPLGWERFAQMVEAATVPVFALGGMSLAELPRARQAGAQGIAGISFGWQGPA